MARLTLVDRVERNFDEIKLSKSAVKVPLVSLKNEPNVRFNENKKPGHLLMSIIKSISSLKVPDNRKPKPKDAETIILKTRREKQVSLGGYGTIGKSYALSSSAYLDYGKLFSYLGKFRAAFSSSSSAQFSIESQDGLTQASVLEAVETGARFTKYLSKPGSDAYASLSSAVPITGINADEWAQFKIWVQLNPVLYKLKVSLS